MRLAIRAIMFLTPILFSGSLSVAQQYASRVFGSAVVFQEGNLLPETLTTNRSAVVISVPDVDGNYSLRGNWKKMAEEAHKGFRRVGIDAISYLHADDLNAGPEVHRVYAELLRTRGIQNLIFLDFDGVTYRLLVTSFSESGLTQGQNAWNQSNADFDRLLLRMGRQILLQDLPRGNMLIPERPEFMEELVAFTGTRLENFPSRIRSLGIAVVTFPKANTDTITNPEVLEHLNAYNVQIDSMNSKLEGIMATYPFSYQFVTFSDEESLYKAGFQYALMPFCSSGSNIKKGLKYQTNVRETDYITITYDESGRKRLEKIPVEANLCKYYFRQTIVHDIHTGNDWDADVTWEKALNNFILNLRAAFRM